MEATNGGTMNTKAMNPSTSGPILRMIKCQYLGKDRLRFG